DDGDTDFLVREGEPLMVSPYGHARSTWSVARKPSQGKDFYSLLRKAVGGADLDPDDPKCPNFSFLMANLIRGGLFQMTNKKEKKDEAKDEMEGQADAA
ncbi:MAG: type I-F CRISPR-associated protein Cas7f/Csy3, partial [Azospirillum sp.]|nr:type I-F CRISPR-associated protein Cas7f/Csy3 [Azospirillum sp.]